MERLLEYVFVDDFPRKKNTKELYQTEIMWFRDKND